MTPRTHGSIASGPLQSQLRSSPSMPMHRSRRLNLLIHCLENQTYGSGEKDETTPRPINSRASFVPWGNACNSRLPVLIRVAHTCTTLNIQPQKLNLASKIKSCLTNFYVKPPPDEIHGARACHVMCFCWGLAETDYSFIHAMSYPKNNF